MGARRTTWKTARRWPSCARRGTALWRTRVATWAAVLGMVLAGARGTADDAVAQRATQWHQWRGPLATGVAPHGDPPLKWDASTHVRWRVEIPGRGGSTPIVWNGRVFLTTAVNTEQVVADAARPEDQPERPFGIKYPNTIYQYKVLCLDWETGQVLWERTAATELPHEGHHGDNTFASSSPITDGRALYVSFGSRGLYAYSLDGELLWKHALPNVKTRLSFGEASSPVVHGDRVVLVRDNEEASKIVVIDAKTGAAVWEAAREEVSAWATPLITEFQGRTQVITNASRRVRSYDLATGELIWECGGQVANVIPSPLRYADQVICLSGYRGSAALSLPLAASGDITDKQQEAWRFDRDTPYVPSPLLYQDRLIFNKLNTAILTILDARTGAPVLEASRIPDLGNMYASPVAAAGRIYFLGRGGTTVVLQAGDKIEVLATNQLDDGFDASPAIVGKRMLLRGYRALYCLEDSSGGE